MNIEFRTPIDFPRGTLLELLRQAYAYEPRYEQCWASAWRDCDAFFYDHPDIAKSCVIVSALAGEAVGFVSWDPRKLPQSVEIGQNGVAAKHKGKGFGRTQMREAVRVIRAKGAGKILVTTNAMLIPARRMYEGAGFVLHQTRENHDSSAAFAGDYLDYQILL